MRRGKQRNSLHTKELKCNPVISIPLIYIEQTLRDSVGQGVLACCSSWGCRVRHDGATDQQQYILSAYSVSGTMLGRERSEISTGHCPQEFTGCQTKEWIRQACSVASTGYTTGKQTHITQPSRS